MAAGLIALVVVIVGGILIIAGIVVGFYNSMVSLRNRTDNAWHQIDVQLRKRYDLIPNLVETVKGYAKHERETLEKVIAARKIGIDAKTVKEQAKAENMITDTLKSLFAVSERYPDLKADAHFSRLMEELNGIESNIAYARQFFNDTVMKFNTRIQTFPGNMLARIFNFNVKDYFEIVEPAAREPVKVEF
jgi:LemA protein